MSELGFGKIPGTEFPLTTAYNLTVVGAGFSHPNAKIRELVEALQPTPPPQEGPRSSYDHVDVEARLASPQGYTDSSVFDGLAHNQGLPGSNWGWRGTRPWTTRREALGFTGEECKAYEGPFYLQGKNPTCNSWATIHGLLAAGATPPIPLATDLLNKALPDNNGNKGLTTEAVGGLIQEHPETDMALAIFPEDWSRKLSVPQVAAFIKRVVGAGGSVLANVHGDTYHALCVAGYRIDHRGYMDVQVIDAACGVGALTIEALTREVNKGNLGPRLAAITTKS